MNEHQLDYHSDFHNSDIAARKQHLPSDLTGDYNQDSLTNSMELELTPHQPWERLICLLNIVALIE